MSETWHAVDSFVEGLLIGPDEALDAALDANAAAGLPPIAVTPSQGKLLHLLARSIGARSILEIGTLGGYSSIWLARALTQGGRLVTLEANADYAKLAAANIAARGPGRRRRPARRARRWTRCRGSPPSCRAVRPDVHRRRQGAHARLLRVGAADVAHRQPDRRRQRRARRRDRRPRERSRSPTCAARAACTSCSPPARRWAAASAPRRSRRSAPRAMTASRSRWCSATTRALSRGAKAAKSMQVATAAPGSAARRRLPAQARRSRRA